MNKPHKILVLSDNALGATINHSNDSGCAYIDLNVEFVDACDVYSIRQALQLVSQVQPEIVVIDYFHVGRGYRAFRKPKTLANRIAKFVRKRFPHIVRIGSTYMVDEELVDLSFIRRFRPSILHQCCSIIEERLT